MDKPKKSNKTKIIIIIIAIIIVLAALAIVLALCLRKKSKDNSKRTLNYYPEQYDTIFYSIVEKSNYFHILEKQRVMCVRSPCNPITKVTKEIKDKDEIRNLTILFDELFNRTQTKEKTIKENELTYEQKEIINTIFKNHEINITQIRYEILNDTSQYDSKYSKRGYYIEKMNDTDSVILTIAMGMKNSGGYSIRIKSFSIYSGYVDIEVEETSPESGHIVTQAVTYPCVKIKFDKKPDIIHIINTEIYEVFEEVEI